MAGLLTEKIRESQKRKGLLDLWSGLLTDTGLPELFSGKVGGHTLEQGIQNRLQPNSLRPALSPQQMVEAGLNIAGVAPVGATVWHGSPHKFSKFDMSKIGTGEGAQAYGHGLYLAESPEVAMNYKEFVKPVKNSDLQNAKSILREMKTDNWNRYKPEDIERQQYIVDHYTKRLENKSLYKVDIPDESIPRMLDWDKPLSEQSQEVQRALRNIGITEAKNGEDLYWKLKRTKYGVRESMPGNANVAEAQVYASDLLKQQGIPGIRYLDGGSRNAGQGTSNYVLFDDQLPRILERNGEPTGLQPWAPGEANSLLGIRSAPMRPRNALGQEIPPTKYELAHQTAQRNASLPVEQGGLGLPEGNTAMDRARAMGFDTDAYHATQADFSKFKKTAKTPYGDRFFFSPDSEYAGQYADIDSAIAGNTEKIKAWKTKNSGDAGPNVMPVLLKNGEFKDWTHISPEYVVRDPSVIRSRFAAFDPMKRNSSDLLAGLYPWAVPLSAGLLGSLSLLPSDAEAR